MGADETFVSAKVNGASISPGLAWYSSESVFQFRILGARLSPESGGSFTTGCGGGVGGTGGFALTTGAGAAGTGAGVNLVSEVLQPAKRARDNPMEAAT